MKSFRIGGLEIRVPIIQGGMGVGISLSGLAVAVANEGGVGVISCAGLGLLYKEKAENYIQSSIEGLKAELQKARSATKGIIGVNIMVALTNFEDMVKTYMRPEKVNWQTKLMEHYPNTDNLILLIRILELPHRIINKVMKVLGIKYKL